MKHPLGSTVAALLVGSALHWSAPAQNAPDNPNAADKKNAGAHQSTPGNFAEGGAVPDGIFRHLGETLLMQKGHAEKVKRELKMAGGITIEPNGTVTFKDGHKFKLKENQMTTFDGQLKNVTPALLPEPSASGR